MPKTETLVFLTCTILLYEFRHRTKDSYENCITDKRKEKLLIKMNNKTHISIYILYIN